MTYSAFGERLNLFLYRQNIRKLTPEEVSLAREWSFAFIRREHPHLNEQQVERFYDNLLNVRVTVVDEWTQRME
jgi:hypothetical protein